MEGEKHKHIIPDGEFDKLIPRPRGVTETIKRGADLEDTIQFLPKAMQRVVWQTKGISHLLQGDTLEQTCFNIWYRLYTRIPYVKDDQGKEQIRSPRCTWWQRRADCDDFSVFVSSILCNLGIPHLFRIAKYTEKMGYQHIYVVVPNESNEIIIDCVLNRFNKEVPFIQKIDKAMDLQFLDGVDDKFSGSTIGNIDARDLLEGDLGELGKRLRDTKLGKKLKEGLHLVNRANPATALLRAGVLACMKINMFKVAGMLRYTYLSDEEAKRKGIDMKKFPKLKAIREKLEKIFYGAGGKTENLKKAILTGRGNRNKEVPLSGLGSLDTNDYDESTRLPELLGVPMYTSEMQEVNGLGELGVATEAAIAAATSAMTALAALIKQLGPLKQGGDTDTASSDGSSSTDANTNTSGDDGSGGGGGGTNTDTNANRDAAAPADASTDTNKPTGGGANGKKDTPATATGDDSEEDSGDDKSKRDAMSNSSAKNNSNKPDGKNDGFIQRAKDWAKENKAAATMIGVAVVTGLGFGGYKLATYIKSRNKSNQPALSGVPKKRRKKRKGTSHKKVKVQRLR